MFKTRLAKYDYLFLDIDGILLDFHSQYKHLKYKYSVNDYIEIFKPYLFKLDNSYEIIKFSKQLSNRIFLLSNYGDKESRYFQRYNNLLEEFGSVFWNKLILLDIGSNKGEFIKQQYGGFNNLLIDDYIQNVKDCRRLNIEAIHYDNNICKN